MTNTGRTLLLLSLLGTATLTACDKDSAPTANTPGVMPASSAAANASSDSATVATVNGKPIDQLTYDSYARQRAAAQPQTALPEERKVIIDDMITREVIYQEAINQGLENNPATKAEIDNAQRNILAGAALIKFVEKDKLSDEVLKKEYETNIVKLVSKNYNARHILVKEEKEARDIIALLDKGGDFSALAKQKSQDAVSALKGGELGWFEAGQMVKPFTDAAAALEKGQYTKTPVQTDFGWHVILLTDIKDVAPPEFTKVKENVRAMLQTKQIKDYVEQLKARAKVEIVAPVRQATPVVAVPAPAVAPAP